MRIIRKLLTALKAMADTKKLLSATEAGVLVLSICPMLHQPQIPPQMIE